MNNKDLVGHYIMSAYYSSDGSSVFLKTKNTVLCLQAYGDCCARTYFAHVNGSHALVNATVLAVEDLAQSSSEVDYETIDVWGHRIITDQGTCTFDMRMEHNGYYGGSLEGPTVVPGVPPHCNPLRDF